MRLASKEQAGGLPDLGCACATVRRTARAITQLYDRHLRDSGLEASQFALLSVLAARPGSKQASLGRMLVLEKATLSRNLKLLKNKGWIQPVPAHDRRQHGFKLTGAGRRLLEAATPGWKQAQTQLRQSMRGSEWDRMWAVLGTAASAAQQALKN